MYWFIHCVFGIAWQLASLICFFCLVWWGSSLYKRLICERKFCMLVSSDAHSSIDRRKLSNGIIWRDLNFHYPTQTASRRHGIRTFDRKWDGSSSRMTFRCFGYVFKLFSRSLIKFMNKLKKRPWAHWYLAFSQNQRVQVIFQRTQKDINQHDKKFTSVEFLFSTSDP